MPLGTPEEVRQATWQAIREAGPGGGYFVGSSSELGSDILLENIIAMIDAAREMGRYPIAPRLIDLLEGLPLR